MQHLFRVLRTVKNVININSLFIVFEVNLIREAPNKNATKGIKANRVTERRGGDQRISLVQAAQEFLTQPGFLLLVSVIAMRDVGQRLGEQTRILCTIRPDARLGLIPRYTRSRRSEEHT